MRILHFSDLHVWRRAFDFHDPAFKRFLGLANLLLRRGRAFPPSHSRAVVDAILHADADLVVFTGDLTTTALADEFRAARDLLEPIRDKWNDRFFLIPGNHDRYTPRTIHRRLFEDNFAHARFDDEQRPVRAAALNQRLAIVAFDSSVPRPIQSTGLFTPTLAEALDTELDRQARDNRRVILVGHYPYATPPSVHMKRGHRLVGAQHLLDIVKRHKPILYLHGHKHRRWAFRPPHTPHTLCVNSGSAGLDSPNPLIRAGFALITLHDNTGLPTQVEARILPPPSPRPTPLPSPNHPHPDAAGFDSISFLSP